MDKIPGRATMRLRLVSCVLLGVAFFLPEDCSAQTSEPFAITDNSFLVEEAFNQEPHIFQNIAAFRRAGSGWEVAFTQEWPLFAQRHQVSYSVPYRSADGASGVGDAFVHYRLQLWEERDGRPAFSPRASLIVPTASGGAGDRSFGWELNLPFSKQMGDVYLHGNAGMTHLPAAQVAGATFNLLTPHVAGSVIWRTRPMFNLMVESVVDWSEGVVEGRTSRRAIVTLVPGFRTGWDVGADTQVVVGLGIPLTFRDEGEVAGVLLYGSYELPFVRTR